MHVQAHYYQQFDADLARDVPAEAFGGWRSAEIELAPAHTAVVLMHAWDLGPPEAHPGQFRACDELIRSYQICRTVLPPLLAGVRASALPLFHVVGGRGYYEQLPGYQHAAAIAEPPHEHRHRAVPDPVHEKLTAFRRDHVFPGAHNLDDIHAAWQDMDFPAEARPLDHEPVAANAEQLAAVAAEAGINHLIYAGFNVDWCLLMSAGGMIDMQRRGFACSVIRDAVTAVENRESARARWGLAMGLWRVSVNFGFVFDSADLLAALRSSD